MAKTKKIKNNTNDKITPFVTLEKLYRMGYDISNEKEIMKLQMSAFRGMKNKTMEDYDNLDELQRCIKDKTLLNFFTREIIEKVDKEKISLNTNEEYTKENEEGAEIYGK